jgi:hypothetical protein
MHQQFNIQQLYVLPTLYLYVLHLSENSDLCHLLHKLIDFYNRDEKCLLRGTNWVFKGLKIKLVGPVVKLNSIQKDSELVFTKERREEVRLLRRQE